MPITFTFKRAITSSGSAAAVSTTINTAPVPLPAISIIPPSISGESDDPLDAFMRTIEVVPPSKLTRGEICETTAGDDDDNDDDDTFSGAATTSSRHKRARVLDTTATTTTTTATNDGEESDVDISSGEWESKVSSSTSVSGHYSVTPLLPVVNTSSTGNDNLDHVTVLAPLPLVSPQQQTTSLSDEWTQMRVELTPNQFVSFSPAQSWSQINGLPTALITAAIAKGLSAPTPIQTALIPFLLAGIDACAVAPTGSGKTASFLLPLLAAAGAACAVGAIGGGPIALILSPTRELAAQIATLARQLSRAAAAASEVSGRSGGGGGGGGDGLNSGLSPALNIALLSGGASVWEQALSLRTASIAIGTPGRIVALARGAPRAPLILSRITYLVLDEADRLLDLGFGPAVRSILSAATAPGRVTAFVTATMPQHARALAVTALAPSRKVSIIVSAGGGGGGNIDSGGGVKSGDVLAHHEAVITRGGDAGKLNFILDTLPMLIARAYAYDSESAIDASDIKRVIIFVNSHVNADTLANTLSKVSRVSDALGRGGGGGGGGGGCVMALHGGMDQPSRDISLRAFRNGTCLALIATDVAARGIDIPGIALVISADPPRVSDALVHRVGRAGRVGAGGIRAHGLVISLIDERDKNGARIVMNVLKAGGHNVGVDLTLACR